MDWDELEPKKKTVIQVGEDLSNLSVEELQHRIGKLANEIERVRAEIEAKRRTQSAAEDGFRS